MFKTKLHIQHTNNTTHKQVWEIAARWSAMHDKYTKRHPTKRRRDIRHPTKRRDIRHPKNTRRDIRQNEQNIRQNGTQRIHEEGLVFANSAFAAVRGEWVPSDICPLLWTQANIVCIYIYIFIIIISSVRIVIIIIIIIMIILTIIIIIIIIIIIGEPGRGDPPHGGEPRRFQVSGPPRLATGRAGRFPGDAISAG